MNKGNVRDEFLKLYQGKLGEIEDSLQGNRRRARDSPGANVSHSDTNKFALSNLALNQQGVSSEYKSVINMLNSISVENVESVVLGSIFTVKNLKTGESKIYYLVNSSGGESIYVDDEEIVSISVAAPLAQAALAKEEGDTFNIKNTEYEIAYIQ